MSKIIWDQVGKKIYETGVSKGVLFLTDDTGAYSKGVAWNGLSQVTESPSGGEATSVYADNIKYLNMLSAEEFNATIEAYTYPPEFGECDGSKEVAPGVMIGQQDRLTFGFSYETIVGNDVKLNNYGRKIHIVYGATASPSEKNYQTVNDSPEAAAFSWEIKTTPVPVENFKPTATMVIDSTKTSAEKMAALEAIIYGSEESEPRLPLPDEIIGLMKDETVGASVMRASRKSTL